MTALLDPLVLKPGGYLIEENKITGQKFEADTFTCVHCQRVVIKNQKRTRPRNTCRKCMKWTCDYAACVKECNPIERDGERAYKDLLGQPWMLRHRGEPVDRIVDQYGNPILVLRKDHGMTLREMEKKVNKEERKIYVALRQVSG